MKENKGSLFYILLLQKMFSQLNLFKIKLLLKSIYTDIHFSLIVFSLI